MDSAETVEKICHLPFAAEYAKSNRSSCKHCKDVIAFESLRLSAREPSRFFDGLQDNWYHERCFWNKLRPGKDEINERSIRGMDWLRWEDQEKIREKILIFQTRRSPNTMKSAQDDSYLSFKAEHSLTNRGKCIACKTNFEKGEMKIGQKSKWYHAHCIFIAGKKYSGHVTDIVGFVAMTDEEQKKIRELCSQSEHKENQSEVEVVKTEVTTAVIHKVDSDDCIVIDDENPSPSSSSKVEVRQLEKKESPISIDGPSIKKPRVEVDAKALEKNKMKLKKQSELIWELREGMQGNLSKKDMSTLLEVNGQEVPTDLEKLLDRLVDCALFGKPACCPKCSTGQLVYSTSNKTYMCLGYATEYTKCTYNSKNPIRSPFAIPVEMCKNDYLKTARINYLSSRVYPLEEQQVVEHGDKSSFKYLGARGRNHFHAAEMYDGQMKSGHSVATGKSRQIIKNGTVVDPEFEYAEVCHVYKDETGLYSTALSLTDIACNKNSYYKLQLLKHDGRDLFYVFRSWGRVGTAVGGTKHEDFGDIYSAVMSFKSIFLEKTGNEWDNRKYFRKRPGKMNIVETDYTEFEDVATSQVLPGSKTLLPKPVKEIMMTIFDVENMKAAMQSFELDIDKMPLGKLSRKQIMSAFSVLNELQALLDCARGRLDQERIIDITNRFYTFIPHSFGMKEPEKLNNAKILKQKTEMLEALLDIQFAYETVKSDSTKIPVNVDPVDSHYHDLKCQMEPLDRTSEEFKILEGYLNTSRGSTHYVNFDLLDIIKLNKENETKDFKYKLGNRKLLWHGSGKMNYAGILGKGLRIAPPEAPMSGYMFGKGVYFADMFTKSSFYCRASSGDEAYLLLCDVALGNQREELFARSHTDVSIKPFNSVKGCGNESPDPSGDYAHPDGYVIPCGKPIKNFAGKQHSSDYSLLYNEYIVYDTTQIRLRYLVRMRMRSARHL